MKGPLTPNGNYSGRHVEGKKREGSESKSLGGGGGAFEEEGGTGKRKEVASSRGKTCPKEERTTTTRGGKDRILKGKKFRQGKGQRISSGNADSHHQRRGDPRKRPVVPRHYEQKEDFPYKGKKGTKRSSSRNPFTHLNIREGKRQPGVVKEATGALLLCRKGGISIPPLEKKKPWYSTLSCTVPDEGRAHGQLQKERGKNPDKKKKGAVSSETRSEKGNLLIQKSGKKKKSAYRGKEKTTAGIYRGGEAGGSRKREESFDCMAKKGDDRNVGREKRISKKKGGPPSSC